MMRFLILSSALLTSFVFVGSGALHAGDLSYVPPGGAEEKAQATDDALNYFSSGKHKKEDMAIQQELRDSGEGVPQSQLEQLPDTLNIEGKAELKVKDGQLVTSRAQEEGYIDCESAPVDAEGNKPDECIQEKGTEPDSSEATNMTETPKTLDAQLEEKQTETRTDVANPNSTASTAGHVGHSAVVDKQRGAKTNIISNTDTGVKLAE